MFQNHMREQTTLQSTCQLHIIVAAKSAPINTARLSQEAHLLICDSSIETYLKPLFFLNSCCFILPLKPITQNLRLHCARFDLCTSRDNASPFISSTPWSGLLWLQKYEMIPTVFLPQMVLKGKLLEMGKVGKDGDLKGYKKRGEVSFSHGVMKHFITAFLWLRSSSDIINLTLCESKTLWKKLQHCSLQTSASNICTSRAFCSPECLCMRIWDQFRFWWKKNVQVESGGLLLFTLCSGF